MRWLLLCTLCVLTLFGFIFWDIYTKGISALSWEFLLSAPRKGMTEGGIMPAIVGTVYVTLITALFAVPFGVATAIYLNEYAHDTRSTRLIRAAIRNLAGIPSIIYGLFGLAIFVEGFGFGPSLLASGLTLGLLTLPYVVATSEEALRNVPLQYREGALALGATRWQSIRSVVLPSAIPGIVTGSLLGLSRAAGETAPILFTGVAFYQRYLPVSVRDEFMALPYHLFILSTQHHAIQEVRPLAYGAALVLLSLVLALNLMAFFLRAHYRRHII
jgi:phosphate transport system permease protein